MSRAFKIQTQSGKSQIRWHLYLPVKCLLLLPSVTLSIWFSDFVSRRNKKYGINNLCRDHFSHKLTIIWVFETDWTAWASYSTTSVHSPPPPQIMTAGAGVTQGFPRIGFPLTTSRRPIFLHLALGRGSERDKTKRIRFQITRFGLKRCWQGGVLTVWTTRERGAAGSCRSGLELVEGKQTRCASSHRSILLHNVSSSIQPRLVI